MAFQARPISKIRPSDGCGKDAVLWAVERWYDFPEFGGYLANVSSANGFPNIDEGGITMADFRPVAKASEIAAGEMKLVEFEGEEVVIANVDGSFFAFGNKCTHVGTSRRRRSQR